MQRSLAHRICARPASHVALSVCFGICFFWPIFAMTRPAQTFNFLYVAWALSLAALFALSRGVWEGGASEGGEPRHDEHASDADASLAPSGEERG